MGFDPAPVGPRYAGGGANESCALTWAVAALRGEVESCPEGTGSFLGLGCDHRASSCEVWQCRLWPVQVSDLGAAAATALWWGREEPGGERARVAVRERCGARWRGKAVFLLVTPARSFRWRSWLSGRLEPHLVLYVHNYVWKMAVGFCEHVFRCY